jgi:hypothetical protein
MKKSTKVQLFFGLDCGMMKFFTLKPQPKGQLMSPAFMEYSLAKKITAWAHANREPNQQED